MQQTGHFGMRPFSAMPTAGLVGIPGQQNIGVTAPLQHAFTDMDPITPGIQTSPGIVTPTGPPIVIQYGTGVFNNNL